MVVPEVALSVSSRDKSQRFRIKSAYTRPNSNFNMPGRPTFTDSTEAYKHLEGIEFDAVDPMDISILLGANNPRAVVMMDFRFGSKNQPLAVKTPFG